MNPLRPNDSGRLRHLVLWDGDCGFCRRSTKWLARHDRFGALEFVPNQEADLSPELRAACQKSMHVLKTNGEILRAGRAMMFCAQFTRWHQLARIGQWPVFMPFVEIGYALVARNRALISRFLFTHE